MSEPRSDRDEPYVPTEVLEFHDVTARYGAVTALSGFSGWVGNGEVVALLGANGAGKTTVLRAASGLVPDLEGRIAFCGAWIQQDPPTRIVQMGLVHVPQGRRVFPDQTVEDNLLLGAHPRGRVDEEVRADVAALLERFPRLAGQRRVPAGRLSGGEQQMLCIARALMAGPRMIMVDEPSAGLAPIVQQDVFATLRELAELGLGVLLVEQLAHQALAISDRGYVLDRGELVAWGRPEEIRESGRLIEAYLGRPP